MTGFNGFPQGTLAFLSDLAGHNNKAWFDAHRADYEAFYVAPARDFVEALGPKLRTISPTVQFEPKVNGSLFRINRDIRFAKDKTPYQTKLDLWFWHGNRSGWDAPGFFLRIAPDGVGMGSGMHGFQKPQLDAYRRAVMDERAEKALLKAIATVRSAGPYEVRGATRKALPRGFDATGERADLLLHESLWANFETKASEATKPSFVDFCFRHLKAMAPIGRWLLAEVSPGAQ